MFWSCAILVVMAVHAAPDNLLMNPSFEAVEGDMPAHWRPFVQTQPGAEACLDGKIHCDGQYSVRIDNPDTYASDPANNWSQNVVQDLAGKTLIAGGVIKTDRAGGAAIWVQCWQKEPWRVVHVATTSDEYPISGTKDWTPVALKVKAPKDTDYVVVRCVLKGSGVAWFDDIRLVDAGTDGSLDDAMENLREGVSRHERPREADDAKRELLRDSDALAKSVKELKAGNESLLKEIDQLRKELKGLREQVQPSSAKPVRRVPPLVPHGYDLKEFQ